MFRNNWYIVNSFKLLYQVRLVNSSLRTYENVSLKRKSLTISRHSVLRQPEVFGAIMRQNLQSKSE